jgi:hypothetical protein
MEPTDFFGNLLENNSVNLDSFNALGAGAIDTSTINFDSWLGGFIYGTYSWFYWGVLLLYIASAWIVFQKAGKPGWAVLVPIYNTIVYLNIVGRPWWWLFLLMIPIVGIVFVVLSTHSLSRSFNRGGWFTAGLLFFPWIFTPILAFGHDKYTKLNTI